VAKTIRSLKGIVKSRKSNFFNLNLYFRGEKNEEKDKFEAMLNETILGTKPNVRWDDIAGLENAKKSLQEAVILPIKFPQIFTGTRTPCIIFLI
jgi:SpoVK/Ycf46/Vps4 family AAA+-type ATPase